MSGVWVFRSRSIQLDGGQQRQVARRKVLVHTESNEVITSYDMLESKLGSLGWERYYDDPDLLQFHKHSTVDLISLPRYFNKVQVHSHV